MSRKGEVKHIWSLGDLCYIRDNTHKFTDQEIGDRIGGLTKAQVRGARVMYGIKRRKKHRRAHGDYHEKGSMIIRTHPKTGHKTEYIKTSSGKNGWTHLGRWKILNG